MPLSSKREALEIMKKYGSKDRGDCFFYRHFCRSKKDEECVARKVFYDLFPIVSGELYTIGYDMNPAKYKSALICNISYDTWHTTDGDHISCVYGEMYCTYGSMMGALVPVNRDEILKEAAVIIGHDTCAATDPAGIARFYKEGMTTNDVREAWWKDYGNYMREQEADK